MKATVRACVYACVYACVQLRHSWQWKSYDSMEDAEFPVAGGMQPLVEHTMVVMGRGLISAYFPQTEKQETL